MAMSIFEVIMDLPLFKGISKIHVAEFAERTQVSFRKLSHGEVLLEKEDRCTDLVYILSGEALVSFSTPDGDFTVRQKCGRGTVIGADRLFGMYNNYGLHATAYGTLGVMSFNKEQYLNMLNSNPIYLLNMLNYLSVKNQRVIEAMSSSRKGSLLEAIALRVLVLTEPTSTDIEIQAALPVWEDLTNLREPDLAGQFERLSSEGLISVRDSNIRILSRQRLIEEAFGA